MGMELFAFFSDKSPADAFLWSPSALFGEAPIKAQTVSRDIFPSKPSGTGIAPASFKSERERGNAENRRVRMQ
jgi:hypothetical protein